ncbi:hypothetical protein EV2_006931 [Malus domestica]
MFFSKLKPFHIAPSLSFSSAKLHCSIPMTIQNPPMSSPSHVQGYSSAIPPSKTHLYASFFCTLVHLYLTCGRFSNASGAFRSMRNHGLVPDLPLWNQLLYQFNSSGWVSQVSLLYSEMLSCGVMPNVFTCNILIHSFCKVGNLSFALDFLRTGEIDTVSYNTVIWGFCKKGLAYQAFGFLTQMVKRDIPIDSYTCNTLVKGFCQIGLVEYAARVMDNLVDGGIPQDVVGFNTLIAGHCKAGQVSQALELMDRMGGESLSPDIITYNTLIHGFCSTGDFARAKSLIDMMLRSQTNEECPHDERDDGQNQTEDKNLKPNLITHTTLISSYSKRQGLEEALSLFEEMVMNAIYPDVVAYSSIINGICKYGRLSEAKVLLREMEEMGVDPNHISYTTLVDFLFKAGSSMEALALQSQMVVRGLLFDW